MVSIDTLVRAPSRVGEGPVWDVHARRLSWVDILSGTVHVTTPGETVQTSTIQCPTWIGAVAPREGTGFVAATRRGFAVISADGDYDDRLPFLPDGIRLNDAACDAAGRYWAGSTDEDFAPGQGALHVLSPDWSIRTVLDGLTLPNGIGWSPDGRTLYLVDTVERVMWSFDFEVSSGKLSNQRALVRFDDEQDMPDGLCVDSAGAIWVAMWQGGRIECYAPDGTLSRVLRVPVASPTSCAFGGPDLTTLFVTSAREGLHLDGDTIDGSVLAVHGLDAAGQASHRFAG